MSHCICNVFDKEPYNIVMTVNRRLIERSGPLVLGCRVGTVTVPIGEGKERG